MISLVQILKEAINNPKAIILAGAPGAGKGYVLKGLDLSGLKIMNVDNTYIDLLKKANVSLDLKNSSPEERSKSSKAMATAVRSFRDDIASTIEGKESFILDGTGASYKQTIKLKDELEEVGYDVMMLYVYTDLERSLKQNQDRFEKSGGKDRSLAPAIVLRTWAGVTKNFRAYQNLFGDNFTSVANTLEDQEISDLENIVTKYLKPYKPEGTKPKTPAQQKRSDSKKAKDKEEIKALLNNDFIENVIMTSISKDEAQIRINNFLR